MTAQPSTYDMFALKELYDRKVLSAYWGCDIVYQDLEDFFLLNSLCVCVCNGFVVVDGCGPFNKLNINVKVK